MKKYYVRFNSATQQVDVFSRANNSIIQSVEVSNGIVPSLYVDKIAFALNISGRDQIELEYDIFYEDRYWRELAEESRLEV